MVARYRLAPQFPFPCGLLDCLAAYMYLLTIQPPSTIIMAGDSAGGGMIVRLVWRCSAKYFANLLQYAGYFT